jgi:TorA maturation chaperone TorD
MLKKKNVNEQQYAQDAYRRSDIYSLLSSVYSQEPDENFIEHLNNSPLRHQLAKEEKWDKGFWAQSVQKICEDLAVEYTGLFIGPKNHIPPFESLYNYKEKETRQMWGAVTVEVKKMIESSGLSFEEDYGGIPDHIGIELEFMQKIVKKEAQLWEKKKNDTQLGKTIEFEKKFIDEHLTSWIPDFCQRVIEVAKLDFYRNFAVFTENFVINEKEEVENLLSFFAE